MWVRRRLDIGWMDLIYGGLRCAWPLPARTKRIEDRWAGSAEAVVCLSARSGFDLLLQALALPRGSEVLMTAVNVPDMFHIARSHGLTPVPLDIDPDFLQPDIDQAAAALTSRTRMIVAAHLFGAEPELRPLRAFARKHDLVMVEDRAQAFAGVPSALPPNCDATLASFGPIKRATALGGGILALRDAQLAARVRRIQSDWPRQSRVLFALRLAKYRVLKLASYRLPFAVLMRVLDWLGAGDAWLQRRVGSFGSDDASGWRKQASAPLTALLERRLAAFDAAEADRQRRRGRRLAAILEAHAPVVGGKAPSHSFDLFAVRAPDPKRLIAALRRQGFDAGLRGSLAVLEAPANRPSLDPAGAKRLLAQAVFLPLYAAMPDREVQRMAGIVCERPWPAPRSR